MSRRPRTSNIAIVVKWLQAQGISLYTGAADLETGQRDFGCMDVLTVDEVIKIYDRNRLKAWKEPVHPPHGNKK